MKDKFSRANCGRRKVTKMMGKAGKFSKAGMAAAGRGLALLLCVCGSAACLPGCMAKEPHLAQGSSAAGNPSVQKAPLLYVNGEAVPEAEMEILEQDAERAVLMKALQQWAKEDGVAGTPFLFDDMLRQMEEENRRRVQQKAEGGIIYGVTEYSPLQYYRIRMGEYERALKDRMMDAASEAELEAWYEAHRENFREMGEVSALVTVYADGRVVYESEVSLSPANYRTLSEQNEQLAAVMADLPEGGASGWTDDDGMEWRVRCLSRGEESFQPFAQVRGAVSEQYAEEKLRLELEKRAADSKVEDLRQ